MKSGNLNFLEPSGSLQACNGTALPVYSNDNPRLYKYDKQMYLTLRLLQSTASEHSGIRCRLENHENNAEVGSTDVPNEKSSSSPSPACSKNCFNSWDKLHHNHRARSKDIAAVIPQSLQLKKQVKLASVGSCHNSREGAKSCVRKPACLRNQSGGSDSIWLLTWQLPLCDWSRWAVRCETLDESCRAKKDGVLCGYNSAILHAELGDT